MCVRTERCSDGKQTSVHLTNTGHRRDRRRTTTTVLQMTIDQPAVTSTTAWMGLARQRQVPIVIEIELNEEEMFYTFLLRESVLVCHIKMPSGIQAGRQAGVWPGETETGDWPGRAWGWNFLLHSHILSVVIIIIMLRQWRGLTVCLETIFTSKLPPMELFH